MRNTLEEIISSEYYNSNVLMTKEMYNYCNQFLAHVFICLLYMFRTSLVVHHQEHGIKYCITQFGIIGTIVPIVLCNTAYYAVLLMMND